MLPGRALKGFLELTRRFQPFQLQKSLNCAISQPLKFFKGLSFKALTQESGHGPAQTFGFAGASGERQQRNPTAAFLLS